MSKKEEKVALERRREEILAQMGRGSQTLAMELDRDPEEQAIQLEQQDASVAIVENLRRELADIEDKLLDLED